MGDKNRGLYRKFNVTRTDGRSCPGEKHADCEYLVLDLTHDPHARAAAVRYAKCCRDDGYTLLAADILRQVAMCREIALHRGDDDG